MTLDPANLSPGIYTGTIALTSSSPNIAPQSIPVVLTVTGGPLTAAPTTVSFNQVGSGPAPANQTIQITGAPSGATIGATGTVLSGADWLTVTSSGGTITVSANGSKLPAGTYSGVVTVSVAGASNSPLYIPVTLRVT